MDLLALNVDEAASLAWVSNLGRGMGIFDGLSEELVGGLPFGVPLYVPVADILEDLSAGLFSRNHSSRSGTMEKIPMC